MHFQLWLMNGIKGAGERIKTTTETDNNRLFAG
jgi:hypothetical protein